MSIRASDLKRVLEGEGFSWEPIGDGGCVKISRNGQRTISISLHGGSFEEIDDLFLRGVARQLRIGIETLEAS